MLQGLRNKFRERHVRSASGSLARLFVFRVVFRAVFRAVLLAVTLVSTLAVAPKALASGFICMSVDQDTVINVVFTSINPDGSRRQPRVKEMVVSDPNVSEPFQHVATFLAEDGLLLNRGGQIEALVDLRYPGTSRAGERLGGTKLGALKAINLKIDFSYTDPTSHGAQYAAEVTYIKRNGEVFTQDFDCVVQLDSEDDKDFVSRLNSAVQ